MEDEELGSNLRTFSCFSLWVSAEGWRREEKRGWVLFNLELEDVNDCQIFGDGLESLRHGESDVLLENIQSGSERGVGRWLRWGEGEMECKLGTSSFPKI